MIAAEYLLNIYEYEKTIQCIVSRVNSKRLDAVTDRMTFTNINGYFRFCFRL